MSQSARTIIELNIRHFRELLGMEKERSKRDTLLRLLREQEERLAAVVEMKVC